MRTVLPLVLGTTLRFEVGVIDADGNTEPTCAAFSSTD
jgi:hypothetical protein